MANSSQDLRNIAIFGHGGSGKTAVIDALAYATKVSNRHGNSADGTSISNTEPEEKERNQTLSMHMFRMPIGGKQMNIIDTPGHADFVADAISAFQVVETGLLCVSAAGGLSFHARRLWQEAQKANLGRAIILTHPDSETANFQKILDELRSVFGDKVVPVTYPNADGDGFTEVLSVLDHQGPRATDFRSKLEERVAEADDAVLEGFFESGTLSNEDLEKHFPAAVSKGTLVPLFTVCPPKEIGLNKLVGFIARDLPSPCSFGPRAAAAKDGEVADKLVEPDESAPFVARVFKVMVDPYVGRLTYLRCFRGKLAVEEPVLNANTGKAEKPGGLLGLKGATTEAVTSVSAGDIFAVGKIEHLNLGDTLTVASAPLCFSKTEYPDPIYSLAVAPKARGDEQKINQGLEKLAAEDPCFKVRRHPETSQLLVSGLSPLHLDVQLARLLRRFGVATEHGIPRIPYRETIQQKAEGHHRHKKQSGGRGQFAEVYMRVGPTERGHGFEFIDAVVGGSVPRNFIPEVEKGARKFLGVGSIAGFPVVDVFAELYDGKFHPVDSDQLSFQLAGERAFLDGFTKAKPVLLEPIMEVEIHIPERFTGDVAGSLSTLRGRMSGMEVDNGIQTIKAQVPLKEMQEYSTTLRSMTAGEGTFSMTQSHYEQVPGNVQAEIVAAHKKEQEAAH